MSDPRSRTKHSNKVLSELEKGKEMIKAEANNGMVSLEMGGLCTEWAEEALSIITATYSGFEETEKGAGDRLLGAISEAIREGKIQEWSKVTGSLACLGCGHEHNCSTRGCAIIREAADQLEQGTHKKRIAIDRQALIDLIIDAKRTDPETGSFTEWLADYLIEHLSITQPNEPLTWHELGSMSGKPVYIVYPEEKMGGVGAGT